MTVDFVSAGPDSRRIVASMPWLTTIAHSNHSPSTSRPSGWTIISRSAMAEQMMGVICSTRMIIEGGFGWLPSIFVRVPILAATLPPKPPDQGERFLDCGRNLGALNRMARTCRTASTRVAAIPSSLRHSSSRLSLCLAA
jgi:hypothetical protein